MTWPVAKILTTTYDMEHLYNKQHQQKNII